MLYRAKNGTLALGNQTMDYIAFGVGGKVLVMLPGLGDGLKTVRGTALPFALTYRAFARRYRVYVFSRANPLEKGYTTEAMADDAVRAMDALGIASASVMGVSQGGMIAQYLALKHPARVEKLVLAVTLSRQNCVVRAAIEPWLDMAKRGDYKGLMIDTAEKSYSGAYLRGRRWLFPLLASLGKPKDFSRFCIQAEACLTHDAFGRLAEIKCPTLILGGGGDKIVGAEAAQEIAGQVEGSELIVYDGLGHAAYEEAKGFQADVLRFLKRPCPATLPKGTGAGGCGAKLEKPTCL